MKYTLFVAATVGAAALATQVLAASGEACLTRSRLQSWRAFDDSTVIMTDRLMNQFTVRLNNRCTNLTRPTAGCGRVRLCDSLDVGGAFPPSGVRAYETSFSRVLFGAAIISTTLGASVALSQQPDAPPAKTEEKVCLQANRMMNYDIVDERTLRITDRFFKNYTVRMSSGCVGLTRAPTDLRLQLRSSLGLGCFGRRWRLRRLHQPRPWPNELLRHQRRELRPASAEAAGITGTTLAAKRFRHRAALAHGDAARVRHRRARKRRRGTVVTHRAQRDQQCRDRGLRRA